MGIFANTMAFRRTPEMVWDVMKPEIINCLDQLGGSSTDLSQESSAYGYLSLDPEDGMLLPECLQQITELTDDYGVCAQIVDSDFCVLQLYCKGQLLQECVLGEIYEEFAEFTEAESPDVTLWQPLLLDPANTAALAHIWEEEWIFAEDALRELSKLTGLPLFDDVLFDTLCG